MVVVASGASASVAERAGTQASDSGEPLATLTISTDNVSVRKDGKQKFKPAEDGQSLKEGDTIKTDATGTAEVDYGNDAFTRLDVNTTFTIVVLTDEQGARQVQGSLETGQTWNRTAALTESGSFEQEGAGANATVRGTAFAITCDTVDHCVFTAVVDDIELTGLDGVTQLLTPLDQCDSTDTPGEGELTGVLCGDVTQIPADQLPAWITQNLLRDLILGLPDGGILTGTIVITESGGVVFVPTPAPPGGGENGPVAPVAPVLDDQPIAVEYVSPEITGLEFVPASEIALPEDEYAQFRVQLASSPGGQLYVVFLTLPSDVGKLCSNTSGPCNNVHVRGSGSDPSHRYVAETVFRFTPDDVDDDTTSATGLQFFVETEDGVPSEPSAVIPVTVEDVDDCEIGTEAETVDAAC
ncbi:MAG TPA: hypothetical protein VFW06_07625 [Acidimicrobiia bacterium]|nr:hypothetical protein [Acidimicrobiia bacterium]